MRGKVGCRVTNVAKGGVGVCVDGMAWLLLLLLWLLLWGKNFVHADCGARVVQGRGIVVVLIGETGVPLGLLERSLRLAAETGLNREEEIVVGVLDQLRG
jgi:hypothetical protein